MANLVAPTLLPTEAQIKAQLSAEVDAAIRQSAVAGLITAEINQRVLPCPAKFNKVSAEKDGKVWTATCVSLEYARLSPTSPPKFTWFLRYNGTLQV